MKKFKDSIAHILYQVVLILVKLMPARSGSKQLLLVKTDEIGDYVLFRNFLHAIRSAPKYAGYKVTLVGNNAWKALFEAFDQSTADEVIWVNKNRYKRDLKYRFSVLKSVRKTRASEVVNCVFSRCLILDDGFVFAATGNSKIAMLGDDVNRGRTTLDPSKFIYTDIIDTGKEPMFDAIANAIFVRRLLADTSISYNSFFPARAIKPLLTKPYVVFFLGAGNAERRWPVASYVALAKEICSQYGAQIVLCGGPDDILPADQFVAAYGQQCLNMAGKTSLPEYVDIVAGSRLTVSVDTGPMHIAAASGCPVIGLFSGKFYKRYSPYPAEINSRFFAVYPDFVDKLLQNNDPVIFDHWTMKNNTIKQIPAEKVITLLHEIWNTRGQ